MPQDSKRILIMGAGAIGSVVGGLLAQAGHRVTLVGREAHMAAIRDDGLRISGIWGEHHVVGLCTCSSAPEIPESDVEVIVIAVKSYDTEAAVSAIAPFIGANTLVCAYQNGLGNAECIAETAGWGRTVGVRAIYGARMTAPGAVEVTVIAQPTALGIFSAEAPGGRVRELAALMDAAGLPTVYEEDIAPVIWAKVAYNCALNPLSALLDVPYGRLAEMQETRAVMDEVIEELYTVGKSLGVRLAPETSAEYRQLFYNRLVPPTAVHYASMREDLRHGRRTEVDALNGAIARFGTAQGVATPVNTLLTRLIHAREQGRATL